MSHLYLTKMQDYLLACSALEYSTSNRTTTSSTFTTTTALNKFFAASQQTAMNNNNSSNNNNSANTGFGGLFATSENQASYWYELPLLSDTKIASSYLAFRLGERGQIFHHVQLPSHRILPLIPIVEQVQRRRHSYEETFRSVVYLLTDMVTHEYLFTLQFFAGDSTIYAQVLRPTVQFVVDYVAEMLKDKSTTSSSSSSSLIKLNVNASRDCYGLLILIRHCYSFRGALQHERRLTSLHGFHDSLLMQLWPIFTRNFDMQLSSFNKLQPAHLRTTMVHLRKIDDQLRFILPITKSLTQFIIAITNVVLGAMIIEERQRTAAERLITPTHTTIRIRRKIDSNNNINKNNSKNVISPTINNLQTTNTTHYEIAA